jgi:hypothetical protein
MVEIEDLILELQGQAGICHRSEPGLCDRRHEPQMVNKSLTNLVMPAIDLGRSDRIRNLRIERS